MDCHRPSQSIKIAPVLRQRSLELEGLAYSNRLTLRIGDRIIDCVNVLSIKVEAVAVQSVQINKVQREYGIEYEIQH